MISHAIPSLRVVPHEFAPADLCSGHVALDFVNTATLAWSSGRRLLASAMLHFGAS
jgi:hypothetical protein